MDKISELLATSGVSVKYEVTGNDVAAFVDTLTNRISMLVQEQVSKTLETLLGDEGQDPEAKAVESLKKQTETMLSRAQIREIMGTNYTNQTFRNWEGRGILCPCKYIGRNPMYKVDDVRKFLSYKNM